MIAVTTLINILDKPALVKWANKIGLEGVNLKDYRKKSTSKGTIKHSDIENYLLNGVKFKGYERLKKTLEPFEIVGCEVEVKTKELVGRIDLILRRDNITYIVDFKTSKYVYLSTKLQLSSYKHMYNADKIGIISFDHMKLNILNINTQKYYTIVKRLYQINELMRDLKERL